MNHNLMATIGRTLLASWQSPAATPLHSFATTFSRLITNSKQATILLGKICWGMTIYVMEKEQENIICQLYKQGLSIRKIEAKVDSCFETIRKIILKNKLTRSQTKHSYKEDQFEKIDDELKAYWFGFLYADADISLKKCRIKLALAHKDYSHLEAFQAFMETTSPITKYNYSKNKKNERLRANAIYINNKKIVTDLIRFGCVPNKSKILQFPSFIEDCLLRHFIRGYIDGDGWITLDKDRLRIGMLGTQSVLSGIQRTLAAKIGHKPVKLVPRSNVYQILFGSKPTYQKLWNFLYNGSTICLERKKTIFESYLTNI